MAVWKAIIASGVRVFFSISDNGNLETGLVNADFTAILIKPTDLTSLVLTVSESIQRAGIYFVDIPTSFLTTHGAGQYGLSVGAHKGGLDAETILPIEVNQKDIDNLNLDTIADGFLDRSNAVEAGFTHRQTLRLIAAVLLGKSTGGPANTVFRGMDDGADRVASISDSDGNRSGVTLSP